jgi:hypothetical protein
MANVKGTVKAAAEKVAEVVEKAVESAVGIVEVESVEIGKVAHTIFTEKGMITFENGIAKVAEDVAKHLRELGYIK